MAGVTAMAVVVRCRVGEVGMVGIRVRRAYRGSAFFRRRWCGVSTIAAVTAAVVLASLVSSPPAWAEPAPTDPAGRPVRSVPVSGVRAEPATVSQSQREPWSPSGAAWPAAGVSVVDLPAAARARAGGLPVWAGRPSSGAPAAGPRAGGSLAAAGGPSRLRVEVLDRAAAERAGVAGVLLRLSWVDSPSAAGAASVEVDYSGFRGVFGADWAARLGLVRLPACVLVSPAEPGCSRGEPLDARNNPTTGRVWADVAVAAQLVSAGDRRVALALGEPVPDSGGTVLAVMSVESSDGNGPDFSKTPLSPAFSWQAGTQSGDFSWSYPLRSPPAPAGAAPSVSLGYSSGAVDGRTNGQGAQTSWLGEGWSYEPGYVERAYRSCADDVATYRDAKLYPGNGTGGFVGTSSTAGVAWDSNGTLISPGDVTGDGRVDVVFREATGPRRRLFLTTGNGAGFDEPAVWDQGDWTAAQLMFSPGDFSGDGRSDVIYRDAAHANLYLRRVGWPFADLRPGGLLRRRQARCDLPQQRQQQPVPGARQRRGRVHRDHLPDRRRVGRLRRAGGGRRWRRRRQARRGGHGGLGEEPVLPERHRRSVLAWRERHDRVGRARHGAGPR